jgi:hypothetical protein
MFFQEYVISNDGSARMDEASSSNNSIRIQDRMLDQEKEASAICAKLEIGKCV